MTARIRSHAVSISLFLLFLAPQLLVPQSAPAFASESAAAANLAASCEQGHYTRQAQWGADGKIDSGKAVELMQSIACTSYISGYLESVRNLSKDRDIRLPFCLPSPIAAERVAMLFVSWVKASPARAQLGRGEALAATLSEAFPCQ